MEVIKFSDFRIIPDITSIKNQDMTDEEYFSEKYAKYISNSRLKWIDPEAGGTPELFKAPPKLKTQSLAIGSSVHECLLQPESFELGPKTNKPGGKLGMVLDEIVANTEDDLDTAIEKACLKVDYYSSSINSKKASIKKALATYNTSLSGLNLEETTKERIFLSDRDYDTVKGCLDSCFANTAIMNLLHPTDSFGEEVESHNEDAFFMDFLVTYKGSKCATLRFKLKADNWTIDFENKIVTLNDLKTTGHSVTNFMKSDGSFYHFSYARQMYIYGLVLWYYCMQKYGVSKETGWKLKANMLVVETIPHYWSRAYQVNPSQLLEGKKMFEELLKRVAYYEIEGYDKEVTFE